jgi:Phage integrase family
VDTLKSNRARAVPLVAELVPIIDRWATDKASEDWLFASPEGGPLRESNWKRSINWPRARTAIGVPSLRGHDLRHTAASIWLGKGADPKVVQRVLGHATAAMTMDLYGHLLDANLWAAAHKIGDISGTFRGHLANSQPWKTAYPVATQAPDLQQHDGAASGIRTPDLRITSASL